MDDSASILFFSRMLRFTNIDEKPQRLPPIYAYRTHPLLPLRQTLASLLSQINYLDKFIKTANNECHFPSEHGLTRDESASIYLYTMDWGDQSLYRALNAILRERDRTVLIPWHGYLKLFDTALTKLPSLQINLWRGINTDVSHNYRESDEFTWWSFSSCSSVVKVVKAFLGCAPTLFLIEAKNGKAISAYSNFPEEKEVILPLGTRLGVMSDALDHPGMNVVHLQEISDMDPQQLASSFASMDVTPKMKPTSGM